MKRMAELISQDRHVLPDDIRLAILDSRLIPGNIRDNCLFLSKEVNFELRKTLFEDYLKLKIDRFIFLKQVDQFILIDYKSIQGEDIYHIDFETLMILLFTTQYQDEIGLRRSLIIANNLLDDRSEELVEYLGISEKRFIKFLQGYSELQDDITLGKVCSFYHLIGTHCSDYQKIQLKKEKH
jgi:hypothetical protein